MLSKAAIAQLGERQTEDLKVPGSIPGLGMFAGRCVLRPRFRTSRKTFRHRDSNPGRSGEGRVS